MRVWQAPRTIGGMRLLLALAAAAPFLMAPAIADAAPGERRFASLTFENDFFVGFDRHYTNGVQAAFLVDVPPLLAWSDERKMVLAFGQRIFTPEDTSRRVPDPGDRPYAAWLYALADLRVRTGVVVDHVTATVGVVGPSARGRQVQNGFHHATGRDPARGWDAQVRNEAAVTIGYERAWPGATSATIAGLPYDISPRVGVTLGNVLTYASAGAVVRYGSALPSDLPTTHISLGPPRDGYRGTAAAGWYAWIGVDAHAVGYNIFLDGNTSGGASGVDRKPLGFDIQAGAALVWPGARLSFAVVQRSREFEGQQRPDRFAQLSVSFPY